jgi:hypothetical protein
MSLEHSPAREDGAFDGPSYTIALFCKAERISRSMLYALWKQRLGPRYYTAGTHRRITEQARRDWHREAEAHVAKLRAEAPSQEA